MVIEQSGRARRFHEADPNRWATCEVIPPDDREPHYRFAARVARHAEAQDTMRLADAHRRRWPNAKPLDAA